MFQRGVGGEGRYTLIFHSGGGEMARLLALLKRDKCCVNAGLWAYEDVSLIDLTFQVVKKNSRV